jgi:hypothetical protein
MMRLTLVFSAMAVLPLLAPAKRVVSPEVEPVIHEGIRYVAPNDDGRRAYIEAWNVQTNKKVWYLTVFTNRIDPGLEEDVQWVFIEAMSVEDAMLLVTSERGNTYRIDLNARAVTQSDATKSATPDATAQLHDIPEVINTAVANGFLAKKYELSFHMNPFYLRGDFNGDGKTDIAFLLKQRSTGKLGIAIINGATDKVTVVGAGNAVGNGSDDFEWMDSWQVYSKGRAAQEAKGSVPHLRGDAFSWVRARQPAR